MSIRINRSLTSKKLVPAIERLFEISAGKVLGLEKTWNPSWGTPVFTVNGRYTTRAWTEWTRGFQFGSALLQYDAAGDDRFLELGRRQTLARMALHLSHAGVHDHGFHIISTYGNLLRLMREGKVAQQEQEQAVYELALKVSGAVQAARWTRLADGTGFIHSFNGPHSLLVDTIRSCRSLAAAHQLGHVLLGEQDERISLLERLVQHGWNTARYNIYYGLGRDLYDTRGRTAHEAIFNTANGVFRCPGTQQGYSPFTTWTSGLAWALLGFAEQLEFLQCLSSEEPVGFLPVPAAESGRKFRPGVSHRARSEKVSVAAVRGVFLDAATATADFYLDQVCADGIPMWDTGAPGLQRLPADYLKEPADPFNGWEPVDSSAAAIAAQGLVRLGNYILDQGRGGAGGRYRQAGLTVASTLFAAPYLCGDPKHQGLLLHSVYHRPNGWDRVAPGQTIPNGESSMWGDYHLRELALLLWREARGESYLTFFDYTGKNRRPG